MNKLKLAVLVCVLAQTSAVLAADEPNARACNQLGREIALRAAEQLPGSLTADARTQLAAIAESVCMDFTPTAEERAAMAAEAGDEPATGNAEEEEGDFASEMFDIEIIDPEERVRRPGLKRR